MAKKKKEKSLTEQLAEGLLELKPNQKIVEDETGERIVEKSLPEAVAEGLMEIDDTQVVVGEGKKAKIVPKPAAKLLAEGLRTPVQLLEADLVTVEEVWDGTIRRLRSEVTAFFEGNRTPHGYRLDDLARQKASFSHPFRRLPAGDERKKELLDAGLIYPDDVLDEILDEVAKIQTAYRAAKKAVTTAFEKSQPVEKWASISLHDHLPGQAKKKKPSPRKKKPAKKKTQKRGS